MRVQTKPVYQESITEKLLNGDLKRPLAIPANEQMASDMRQLDNLKGVNLAVTSSDALRTVLEELSYLRVWAKKSYAGEIQDSDKHVVQTRIDIIKGDIKQRLADTEFNKFRVVETDPATTQGKPMKLKNTSLEALGIENFNIYDKPKVEDIDKAIAKVRQAARRKNKSIIQKSSNKRYNQQARKIMSIKPNSIKPNIKKVSSYQSTELKAISK